ncbi:hypothetical protein LIER_32063 [Lithospermum erythrorhizon]|uniref:Uncharacterized protein n=1 Tax=Lithospermum erythrorhizon TaxID=34254 RepID=A0AAV3RWB2_LITER
MSSCNSSTTPIESKSKLGENSGEPSPAHKACRARHSFVREKVVLGHVRVLHVPSRYEIADILSKGLPSVLFTDFGDSLIIRPPPALTTGVY